MRLIDANELSEWIAEQFCEDMPKHWDRTAEAILQHINEMPTVEPSHYGQCWGCKCDLIENKRGHWIKRNPFMLAVCSECGGVAIGMHGFDETKTPYCPHCGAKMDEEEKDENKT